MNRQCVPAIHDVPVELADLNEHQRTAVSAYKGGYISIWKLAEEMSMTVFDVRKWLSEHEIAQNNSFSDTDTKNA